MKPRNIVSIAAAVIVLSAAGVGVAFLSAPPPAGAQAEEAGPPDVVYDEQNIATDGNGQHLLQFEQGEHGSSCLSGKALYVGVAPARNLDDPGNAPVTFQAVQHTNCNVLVVLLNKNNRPIPNADLRITYTASAVSALGSDVGGQGPAGPQGPEGPEGPQGPPGLDELTSPDVFAALISALDDAAIIGLGLTCDDFASQDVAQAVYEAAGGSDGPLSYLESEGDSDALACSTDGEGDDVPDAE